MQSVSEAHMDGSTMVVNRTDLPTGRVMKELIDRVDAPMAAALTRWREQTRPPSRRGTIYHRDRFVTPDTTFARIRMARLAMDDDVVGGAADTTESLVFSDSSFFVDEEDLPQDETGQEDAWNQWAGDVDLDSRLREMWRQLFMDSQFAVALWWGKASYKVRGRTEAGMPRRKVYDLNVPLGMAVMDTLKVTPVGDFLFGDKQLAYIASPSEADAFDAVIAGRARRSTWSTPGESELEDEVVERLIVERYFPDEVEEARLQRDGVDPTNLFLLDRESVWRHTLTKPGHKRFADVRLASTFPLLDLKQQQRSKDRAFLLAGVNYLVVITIGSEKEPGQQPEIDAMNAQMRTVATLPFIVSDHRLKVEILAPDFKSILERPAYDTVDLRLFARCFQTFVPTGEDAQDPMKLGKVITEGLEGRRKMLRRSIEREVIKRIRKRNPQLTLKPKLMFTPEQISLAFDDAWASFIMELREKGELSRGTLHAAFGFDQDNEAARLRREEREYDKHFSTHVPYSAPAPGKEGEPMGPRQKAALGRQKGGNRNGGGAAPPGSGQGQAPRRPRKKADGGDE